MVPILFRSSPTAKQLVALGHDTPESSLGRELAGCGVSVTDHPRVAAAEGATPATISPTKPTETATTTQTQPRKFLATIFSMTLSTGNRFRLSFRELARRLVPARTDVQATEVAGP
jgi:hypothetical protein